MDATNKKNDKTLLILVIIVVVGVLLLCCCGGILLLFSSTNSNDNSDAESISKEKEDTTQEDRNIDFIDSFDGNRYGWIVGSSSNEYADITRTIADGKYVWDINVKKDATMIAISNPDIEKAKGMTVSVDVEQVSASASTNYNLILFYIDENNYCSFKLNQEYQQYNIGIIKDGVWTDWLKWTRDPVVNYRDINNLKIHSENGTHVFYVNGVEVYRKTDSQLESGGVAIAVQGYESGQFGTWKFDNFEYKKLQ